MTSELIFDTENQLVSYTNSDLVTNVQPIKDYFQKLNTSVLNLGLLPPVVKLITPVNDRNYFCVLVENKPRRQVLCVNYLDDPVVEITLPWHSYVLRFTFDPTKNKITLITTYLFFHSRQISSDKDINGNFFHFPYLPNFYHNGKFCSGRYENPYDTKNFNEAYLAITDVLWGSSFNGDLTPNEIYAIAWKTEIEKLIGTLDQCRTDDQINHRYRSLSKSIFDIASKFSFEEACNSLNKSSSIAANNNVWDQFDFEILATTNKSLTLNDLFRSGA